MVKKHETHHRARVLLDLPFNPRMLLAPSQELYIGWCVPVPAQVGPAKIGDTPVSEILESFCRGEATHVMHHYLLTKDMSIRSYARFHRTTKSCTTWWRTIQPHGVKLQRISHPLTYIHVLHKNDTRTSINNRIGGAKLSTVIQNIEAWGPQFWDNLIYVFYFTPAWPYIYIYMFIHAPRQDSYVEVYEAMMKKNIPIVPNGVMSRCMAVISQHDSGSVSPQASSPGDQEHQLLAWEFDKLYSGTVSSSPNRIYETIHTYMCVYTYVCVYTLYVYMYTCLPVSNFD